MSNKEEAQAAKLEGNSAFKENNFSKAIECFTKAIKADPNDHVLFSNRSGAYASLHDYKKALEDANECIRLQPAWPKGYSRKGLAELHLGNTNAAKESYITGLNYDPNNQVLLDGLKHVEQSTNKQDFMPTIPLNNLLYNNPQLKKYAQEDPNYLTNLMSAINQVSQDPSSFKSLLEKMDAKLKEGFIACITSQQFAYDGFQSDFKTSKKDDTKKYEAKEKSQPTKDIPKHEQEAEELKEKGNKLYKQKNFVEALEEYDKAIEKNPNEILYQNNKAAVYLEMKDYDKCLEICYKAIEKRYEYHAEFSKIAKIYNRMASCYEKMNDLENAIKMYQSSLLEDNNRKTRAALKELERKLETRKKEAYIDPALAEEHKVKGNEYFTKSEYPAAIKEYDEAIKRNPKDAKLYNNRAAAYTKLLEYPLALKDCETAVELDPEYVKAWSRKGFLHMQLKEFTKALNSYNKGLSISPDSKDCILGKNQVIMKIQESNASGDEDKERLNKGLADPEVQEILRDPQFNIILKNITEDPSRIEEYWKDPKCANALEKLIAAGVIRMA